jgi:hypothetical protein
MYIITNGIDAICYSRAVPDPRLVNSSNITPDWYWTEESISKQGRLHSFAKLSFMQLSLCNLSRWHDFIIFGMKGQFAPRSTPSWIYIELQAHPDLPKLEHSHQQAYLI